MLPAPSALKSPQALSAENPAKLVLRGFPYYGAIVLRRLLGRLSLAGFLELIGRPGATITERNWRADREHKQLRRP